MSIAIERRVNRRMTRGIFTIEDLAELPDQLAAHPVMWELWDGELLAMSPPGDIHGSVEARISAVLMVHGDWEGHGRTTGGDVGVVIQLGIPQSCVGADVAFLTSDQLPAQRSPEGYLLTIPALIVEVRGKRARRPKVEEKIERYLARGARMVLDVDPAKATIRVHRPGREVEVLGIDDELTAEGIIPGLRVPIRRLFEDLD